MSEHKVIMYIKTGDIFIWGGGSTCWCDLTRDLGGVEVVVTVTCHYSPDLYEVIGDL